MQLNTKLISKKSYLVLKKPHLHDDTARVGRQSIHKLGTGNRLAKLLLGTFEYHVNNTYLLTGIAAALNYRNSDDEQAVELAKLINQNVSKLILKVFRKERHAIKFVILSLIGKNGPLNNTYVCLKLLYALGIITCEEYEDIELLIAILDELDHDDKKYTYLDNEILEPINYCMIWYCLLIGLYN